MKCLAKVLLFWMISLSCAVGAWQTKSATMSGIVIDAQSRRPISGAVVTVIGDRSKSPTTTDNDGKFIITFAQGVEEGTSVRIRVEKRGYVLYDKWQSVTSVVPLSVELLPVNRARPIQSKAPITSTDRFATLVPFHAEWKDVPVPINENIVDEHEEFFSELVVLADRPAKQPEGWPVYQERNFESGDEQFAFVTRLIQFYVLQSIYSLGRGVSAGMKWTAGIGVTPIEKKAIIPPDAAPYSPTALLDALSANEFLNPVAKLRFGGKPLSLPAGTRVSLLERGGPKSGEVFTCVVRLEKPGYFRIDFEIQPGLGMSNQLPVGFSTAATKGTTTYTLGVTLKYEIQQRSDFGFHPDQYAVWAGALFNGLRKQMEFNSSTKGLETAVAPEASFLVYASADIADYAPDTRLGDILWKGEYTHVQINLADQESEDLSDVDLEISMDMSIAAIGQKTNFPDIVIFPSVADPLGPGSITLVGKDGTKRTVPTVPAGIVTAPVYRIRCNKIFGHSTVQLVVASVVPNTMTPGVEYRSQYAPKRLPKWLNVKGSYKVGLRTLIVDRHLEFNPQ
jgi:hypothetical protein